MEILSYDFIEVTFSHLSTFYLDITPLLAQTLDNVDILADMESAWINFVETGQVWALIIGMFIGYVFKGFTTY
ncbi:MAG: hypothetical protein QNJ18_03655 [Xenococcaceae cyanobacterium MO_167.B52]|nr:hypothetical protein [Xenococcaceae cyanobacterium MO_167.B52]